MNRETLKGQWQQIKGNVKQQWGKLTDDDLTKINGDLDLLKGKIRESYGYAEERVEKELNDFYKNNDLE